jgi:predicted amidophosphoribosyltransferase
MIRLLESRLERSRAVAIEGVIFLAYMALVGALMWRMLRRLRTTLLSCPHCGAKLRGMSENVAAATGRCDSCGGQVIEAEGQDSG